MGTRRTLFLLLYVLILFECGCVDLPLKNKLDEKDVVALVSQIPYGMPEEDAVRFLERKGLTKVCADGDSFGWSDGFDWPNNSRATLGLQIVPKKLNPSGDWVNGIVKGASLSYPDGKEVSIPLRKRGGLDNHASH